MSERAILVVDPDPLQRQLIDVLLADPNAAVVEAGTAREALEYLKEHTPDLAIVAYELPDLDGAELIARLKRVRRLTHVPVLLTTVLHGGIGVAPALRAKARSVGADLLIPKPLGDKNVRERARRLMAERAQTGRQPTEPGARNGRERSTLVLDETLVSLDQEGGVVPNDGSPLGSHRSGSSSAAGYGSDGDGQRDAHEAAHVSGDETRHDTSEADPREELAALRDENARLRRSIEELRRQLGIGKSHDREGGNGRNARRGRGSRKKADDA